MDTKLPAVKQGSPPIFVFFTDGVDDVKKRISPMSSRSESPLSDGKSVVFGRSSLNFSGPSRPYTDSDGLYDYPSSETAFATSSPARRNTRKCERRRERKSSLKTNSKSGRGHRGKMVFFFFFKLEA